MAHVVTVADVEKISFALFPSLFPVVVREVQVVGFHIPIEGMEVYVGRQGTHYTSYKVANMLVEFSTSIPRTQLRPSYGEGFLGVPLQTRRPLKSPTPREQGDQRGASSTQTQQHPGGAHHV